MLDKDHSDDVRNDARGTRGHTPDDDLIAALRVVMIGRSDDETTTHEHTADLSERLRESVVLFGNSPAGRLCGDAAVEIERLRAVEHEYRALLVRLGMAQS